MVKYKNLVLLFIIVILLQISIGLIIYSQLASWNDRANFGDMFGVVNTLFSGLAFAGIIYTIFLQSKELELQREELKLTRKELNRTAKAQEEQVLLTLKVAKINAAIAKYETYANFILSNKMYADDEISYSPSDHRRILKGLEDDIDKLLLHE